ncbi:cyclin-D6-1-like isoform X2 [Oryza brachyantha]|uniref:cyclin-D6-1-like isoform X2 n=1 Tax=Oryza brachyantha TaxID=4533 RepID=UPI001ADA9E28|nr:cyclin-D6-1-like isoform X2 [Oryza brachyantha]
MDVAGEEVVNDEYGYEFDLENPFTSPADEPIASLLDAEGHHSPSVSAASSAARREAAAFISEVRYDGELNVQPRVAYLALNYVDRFLSKRQLAGDGHNPWAPRLLAISCLSLAAKMQRAAAISVADIQRGDPMFGEATIRRMERMVLDALEWRARSVTPLAFLGFFLSSCFPQPRHQPLVDAIKARAVDLLLRVQPEVKMAEFSPSVAAAAALLTAAGEVAGAHLPAFQAGVAACHFEKLRECGEVMAAACGVGPGWTAAAAAGSADTPVTVLGHHRSASSESERTTTVGSAVNSTDAKKRCMGPPRQWG